MQRGSETEKTEKTETASDPNVVKWMRTLALLTGALVFAGFCQIGDALLQWHEAQIRDIETHNLAVATRALTALAQSQASNLSALRQRTQELAATMNRQSGTAPALVKASVLRLNEMPGEGSPDISVDRSSPFCEGPKFDVEAKKTFLAWRVCYTNIGKGPAFMDSVDVFMKVGASHFKCARNCSKNESTRVNPGQKDSTIGFWPVTQAEFDNAMREREGPTIVVFFHYRDGTGHKFGSDICLRHRGYGGFATCSGVYRERDVK